MLKRKIQLLIMSAEEKSPLRCFSPDRPSLACPRFQFRTGQKESEHRQRDKQPKTLRGEERRGAIIFTRVINYYYDFMSSYCPTFFSKL